MSFKFKNSDNQSMPARITHIPGTVSEAFVKGEALMISSTGFWTKLTNGLTIAGFANQTKTLAAADLTLEVIEARGCDRWEAPYTGTPDAAFVIGQVGVDISSDGLTVLSSDVTGGMFAVWDINTNKTTCVVIPRLRTFG